MKLSELTEKLDNSTKNYEDALNSANKIYKDFMMQILSLLDVPQNNYVLLNAPYNKFKEDFETGALAKIKNIPITNLSLSKDDLTKLYRVVTENTNNFSYMFSQDNFYYSTLLILKQGPNYDIALPFKIKIDMKNNTMVINDSPKNIDLTEENIIFTKTNGYIDYIAKFLDTLPSAAINKLNLSNVVEYYLGALPKR